jgi:ABC-2 type transport system permease protein
MTATLVRKLLRDVRPALVAVCVILFCFAALWVKITQRVTSEIAPVFNSVAMFVGDKKLFEGVLFKGPAKVSQAALGWGELNFERPTDFLAMSLLHPIVLVLAVVWSVGRAAGAVAGEIDRGTMELLLSQPIPRNRLIVAHLIVDGLAIPLICLSMFAGMQFGLAVAGDFVPDYSALKNLQKPGGAPINIPIPENPAPLEVKAMGQLPALANTAALMFALSGFTVALSAMGRSRWKVTGLAVLVVVVMFVANTVGQLWEPVAVVRPLTAFFYYQPQKIMLDGNWFNDLGQGWNGGKPLLAVPTVGVLIAVGAIGYAVALRVFARRDLPAPL